MSLRRAVPEFDRVVINDGSKDSTADVVATLGEKQLRLPCNLGYGHALQTGLKYAQTRGYDIVVSLDADGQHRAEDVPRLVRALDEGGVDMVIGSRFCEAQSYNSSINRRLGQLLFSHLTYLLIGHRIYDTSSGFKAMRARAYNVVIDRTFMDFHLETIVLLSLLDFKIMEIPSAVEERKFGRSMHSIASIFRYPLMTILLTMVAVMDALIIRRAR